MGNYPRFFGKDASNLPAWDQQVIEEIQRVRQELEQVSVDLTFLLLMLKSRRDG